MTFEDARREWEALFLRYSEHLDRQDFARWIDDVRGLADAATAYLREVRPFDYRTGQVLVEQCPSCQRYVDLRRDRQGRLYCRRCDATTGGSVS